MQAPWSHLQRVQSCVSMEGVAHPVPSALLSSCSITSLFPHCRGAVGRGTDSCLCTDGEWVFTSLIYHLSAQVQLSDGAEQDPLQAGTKPGTNSAPSSSSPRALSTVSGRSPPNKSLGSSPRAASSCQQGRSLFGNTLGIKVKRKLLK